MANKQVPIEGYPPHYKEFLLQASVEPGGKYIPMPSRAEAFTTRARINQWRALCKTADPETYARVAGIEQRIVKCDSNMDRVADSDPKGTWYIHGRIRGADHIAFFERAGIKPPKLNIDGPASGDALDEFLRGTVNIKPKGEE